MDLSARTRIIWKVGPKKVIVLYREKADKFLSRAEHEEFCLKMGRPLSKAKYY